MEIITLPRLRNAELQTLCESSLTICEPLTVVQAAREKVEAAMAPFKEGMLKVRASAGDKKDFDKVRDRYVLGFIESVRAEAYYPHEDTVSQNTLADLLKVLSKYGGRLTRIPINEETAGIDNMLGEIEKIDLSAITGASLTRWIPLIVAANNSFKAASNEYIEESVSASDTQAASLMAPALIDALEGLYTMLFAHIKLSNDADLVKAYAQIQTLVDSFR